MGYEKEYLVLVNEFKKELREKEKSVYKGKLNFALLGSPLMKSDVLILGINWGGPIEQESGEEMPLINELIAYPEETNNRKLLEFFGKIFDSYSDIEKFLQKSIYTNACFIRTPNTHDGINTELTRFGFNLSQSYLVKIINIIEPKIVICFGNGENPTPTQSISRIIGGLDNWWENLDVGQIVKIGKLANSYYFEGSIKNRNIIVFSFPHSRNMLCWGKNEWDSLNENNIFTRLKKEIRLLI